MESCGGGPINHRATFDGGIQLGVECLEPSASINYLTATLGFDDRMPFLQMLQTLDPSNIDSPLKKNPTKAENQIQEVDSCKALDVPELHSPVMSEAKNQTQVSQYEGLKQEGEVYSEPTHHSKPRLNSGKMHKPKRTKAVVENKKDAEKQRMTHIAVERNRRRQMSEYFSVLRSLLPPAYAEKGDQGSIVGGVIDYVKKLEHLLQSLQAQKRQKQMDEGGNHSNSMPVSSETSNGVSTSTSSSSASFDEDCDKNLQLRKKAEINIRVVQTHVNLHIECDDMKQNQLLKFLVALEEELGLTILHLHITSIRKSSFYSLSLKVEDECKVRSAEQISESVEKVLNSINIYNGTRRSSV